MKITIQLKDIRIQKNMSIRQLAYYSGVSRTHISEIERGKRMPTIEVICMLANALHVKPEELYSYN